MKDFKSKIVKHSVKSLREFGYPSCDESNIFTNPIYVAFFKRMLLDSLGESKECDEVINELLGIISK